MKKSSSIQYFNTKRNNSAAKLGRQLACLLQSHSPGKEPPVVLCIGTDRVTGDSLGPLTGTLLLSYGIREWLPVYGTLDYPIHALNLEAAYFHIKKKHPRNPILAVDASLGSKKHIGYITLGQGSLSPGAGVQKNLTCVGDFYITGIISASSPQAQLALQNTRLASVTSLACCITQGILYACAPMDMAAFDTHSPTIPLFPPEREAG